MSIVEVDAMIDLVIGNIVEHECAHCAGAADDEEEDSLMNRNGGNMTKEKPLKESSRKQISDALRGVPAETKND